MSARVRRLIGSAVVATVAAFGSNAIGQTYFTWGGSSADWNVGGNWLPGGGPPTAVDYSQFTVPRGTSAANPVLNSSSTVGQLTILGTPANGWSLTGTGSLAPGVHNGYDISGAVLGIAGITAWPGAGDFSIGLGNGSGVSLALSGAPSPYGQLNVCSGNRVVLTGNTIASLNGTPVVVNPGTGATGIPPTNLRSGALVLDNSAGNPTGQRMTSNGSVMNFYGGGSALELRGAAGGTSFTGFSTVNFGGGDAYIRMVQNGGAALSAAFPNLSRSTGRHFLFVENQGTGLVGDVGKPTITSSAAGSNFNVTQTFNGVISASTSIGAPWVMVTNRASSSPGATVTGRWANYSGGIVPSTPTTFTGDFSGAAVNANVLFAPNAPGTTSLGATTNSLASMLFEPVVPGATLQLGSNKIKTLSAALSGANDLTITGGSFLLDDASSTAGRNLIVLNPSTSLITDSSLSNAANSALYIGGRGFVVLNGASNQIPFTAAQSVFLNGGVLRVTTSNFVPTNTGINFRGGTLEYDVSGGAAAVTFPVATGSGGVSWCIFANGESSNTDSGGGGFSAYSTTPGNALTVNLGGAGAQVNWNAGLFVPSYYALQFGSIKSNATVVFENPIGLGTGLPAANGVNRNRQINVTRGTGNAADKTRLTGVISGSGGYDLVKTGDGVLETTAANTYDGNTVVRAGELRILGTNVGTGDYIVAGGSLAFGADQSIAALYVNGAGASASVAANGNRYLRVGMLDVGGGALRAAPSGTLDLHDNDMVVTAGTLSGVVEAIASARNFGSWDQPGITSNAARVQPQQATTLGAMTGADYISVLGTSFGPFTVAASDVLVKYTWYGDTDFTGVVDFDDYVRTDAGFNSGFTDWFNGDFDLSGVIDFDDYVLIDLGFNTQSGTLRRAMDYVDGTDRSLAGMDAPALQKVVDHSAQFGADYGTHFLSAVPEPSGPAILVFTALAGCGRARRAGRLQRPVKDLSAGLS